MCAALSNASRSLTVPAPAKINLVLAITGVRADGFHDLTSLVAPVAYGDTLRVVLHPPAAGAADSVPAADILHCDAPGVPTDASNLVLKASAAFAAALAAEGLPLPGQWEFFLEKRIPAGAGLGGGSSDAAVALAAMNTLAGEPLSQEKLYALAAEVGSDCPLFLAQAPVIMRGRGERLEFLQQAACAALRGQRLLLFKPSFGINTGWAYGQMKAADGAMYVAADAVEAELAQWLQAPQQQPVPLFNNMQLPAFAKYVALPTLLEQLRARYPQLRCLMSGSGSACFALLPADASAELVAEISRCVREAWGEDAFCVETTLL